MAPPSGSVSFSDRRRLGPRQILPIEHQQDARAGAWRRWPRAKLNPPRGPLLCSLSVLRLLSCHRRSRRAMSTTIASTSLIRVQVQPANSGARCLGVLGSRCALCDPQAVAITPHPSPLLPRWDPAPPRHQGLVDGIVEAPRLLRIVGASAGGLLEPTNPPVIRRYHPFVGIARSLSSRPRRRRAWPRKRRQLLTINSCAAARRTRRRAVRAPRGCSGDAAPRTLVGDARAAWVCGLGPCGWVRQPARRLGGCRSALASSKWRAEVSLLLIAVAAGAGAARGDAHTRRSSAPCTAPPINALEMFWEIVKSRGRTEDR